MHLTVKQFTIAITVVMLAVVYTFFAVYFFQQQERTAKVIYKIINNDIYSLSYSLSKGLVNKSPKEVVSIRPILDRTVIDNDFIETALLLHNSTVLITTDPFFDKEVLNKQELYESDSVYDELEKRNYFEEKVHFYYNNKKYEYKVVLLIDTEEVQRYFTQYNLGSFVYLVTLPLFVLIAMFILFKHFITIPLEKLRQFAYYQRKVPSSFSLSELEIIRYSMVQTFTRLEQEKNDLYVMSRTDALSGLGNRNALEEHMQHLIENAKRNDVEFAFLFLDLDNFKSVNDSLGHDVGDVLLQNVATIISSIVRTNDFVARIGGDEFIIVIQEYSSLLELKNIIDRIQNNLSQQMIVLTHPISIESSLGVALYPDDGENMISLMKHSDIAMYEAKNKGKAQYHFFTDSLNTRVQNVIALDIGMREALENQEYELYYQPKVDILTSSVVGVEALIRWNSPHNGIVSPQEFIPLAEENGFIVDLGKWVLEEAIKQIKEFQALGIDLKVSVNISTKQLLEKGFCGMLESLLLLYGVRAQSLDIEVTEYLLLKYNEVNSNTIKNLRKMGVSISLDDFGTGYSSLSYLKKFPMDFLKIDKAFVDDYDTKSGAVFIETIVKMGQTLGLGIIAEGIEEEKQLEYLKSIGCDQYQGYFFSKPLPKDDLIKLLK